MRIKPPTEGKRLLGNPKSVITELRGEGSARKLRRRAKESFRDVLAGGREYKKTTKTHKFRNSQYSRKFRRSELKRGVKTPLVKGGSTTNSREKQGRSKGRALDREASHILGSERSNKKVHERLRTGPQRGGSSFEKRAATSKGGSALRRSGRDTKQRTKT